ncbi:hypothetical protein VTK56DRAFT_3698 [Thermocarpiscus australiensis]
MALPRPPKRSLTDNESSCRRFCGTCGSELLRRVFSLGRWIFRGVRTDDGGWWIGSCWQGSNVLCGGLVWFTYFLFFVFLVSRGSLCSRGWRVGLFLYFSIFCFLLGTSLAPAGSPSEPLPAGSPGCGFSSVFPQHRKCGHEWAGFKRASWPFNADSSCILTLSSLGLVPIDVDSYRLLLDTSQAVESPVERGFSSLKRVLVMLDRRRQQAYRQGYTLLTPYSTYSA